MPAIGRIALRLGERDEADEAARHLREEAGGDVEVLLFCADWHAVRSETEAALADVDAALAAQPRRHRIRFARASLLQQARRTQEARTVLADLVRESHGNWRYRAALAELLDGVGEIAAARRQWREALRSAPDVPSIARAVGRLEGEERALVRAREGAQRGRLSAGSHARGTGCRCAGRARCAAGLALPRAASSPTTSSRGWRGRRSR